MLLHRLRTKEKEKNKMGQVVRNVMFSLSFFFFFSASKENINVRPLRGKRLCVRRDVRVSMRETATHLDSGGHCGELIVHIVGAHHETTSGLLYTQEEGGGGERKKKMFRMRLEEREERAPLFF